VEVRCRRTGAMEMVTSGDVGGWVKNKQSA